MSNTPDRQRSSGHLAVHAWSTTQVGGAMILRTSWEVNRNGLGACERTLKPDPSREGLSGKCQGQNRNREIRPSGLVGGPEKNVTSSMTRCARLGSIPTTSGSARARGCNSPAPLTRALRARSGMFSNPIRNRLVQFSVASLLSASLSLCTRSQENGSYREQTANAPNF